MHSVTCEPLALAELGKNRWSVSATAVGRSGHSIRRGKVRDNNAKDGLRLETQIARCKGLRPDIGNKNRREICRSRPTSSLTFNQSLRDQ